VPNVSFSAYKLNFFQRFVEAHAVMFSGNAGLKPKDGEMVISIYSSINSWKIKWSNSVFLLILDFEALDVAHQLEGNYFLL